MTDDEIVAQWQRHLRQNIQDGRVPESLSLCSQFGQLLGEESDIGGVLEISEVHTSYKRGSIYLFHLFPPSSTNSFKQKFLVWDKAPNDDDDDEEEGSGGGGGGELQQPQEEHHEIIGRVAVQSLEQMKYVFNGRSTTVSCCLGWETVDSEVLVKHFVRLLQAIPASMRGRLTLDNIPFAITQTTAGRKALRDLWTGFQPKHSFTDREWEEFDLEELPSLFDISVSRGNQIEVPLSLEAQEQVLQTIAELHQCANSNPSVRGYFSEIRLEVEEHFRFNLRHHHNNTVATFSKLRYNGSLTDNVINFIKRTCKRVVLYSNTGTSDTVNNTWIAKLLQNLDGQDVILKEVHLSCKTGFPFQKLVDILKKDVQLSGVSLDLPSYLELRGQYVAAAIDLLRNHNATIVQISPLSQDPVVEYYLSLNRMGRGLAMKDSCDASQLISILREVASGHDLQSNGMRGPEFSNTTKVSLIYDLLQLNPFFKSFCDGIAKAKEAKGQQMILPRKRRLQ